MWLRVHGQRRPRGRTGPDRPRRRSADRLGDVRELPLRVAGRRCAQLLGGPDLRHEAGRVAALLRRGGPGPAASGGTSRSSSCRRSPRSATSSGWWACPTRSCASRGATSGSGRGTTNGSSGRSGRSTHQQAMQVMVYDDRHRPASLDDDPSWRRWSSAEPGAWSEPEPGTFEPGPTESGWSELRYHHLVPSPEQWDAIRQGEPPGPARPSLITDLLLVQHRRLGLGSPRPPPAARAWLQPHWVGDLTVSMRLTVRRSAGRLRLELIKEGRPHRCEIDLATGAGAALPRRGAPGTGRADADLPGRDLRPDLRQRRRPVDPLGRPAISRSARASATRRAPSPDRPPPPTWSRYGSPPSRPRSPSTAWS